MRTWIPLATLSLSLLAACGPGNTQRLLRDAVDAKQGTLDDCYEQALTRDESIAGTVRAKLYVEAKTGRVNQVDVLESVGDETLVSCIKDVLTGIKVDDPAKVNVTVDYVFELVPDERGGGEVVEQ